MHLSKMKYMDIQFNLKISYYHTLRHLKTYSNFDHSPTELKSSTFLKIHVKTGGGGLATNFPRFYLENPMVRGARRATVHGLQELDTT